MLMSWPDLALCAQVLADQCAGCVELLACTFPCQTHLERVVYLGRKSLRSVGSNHLGPGTSLTLSPRALLSTVRARLRVATVAAAGFRAGCRDRPACTGARWPGEMGMRQRHQSDPWETARQPCPVPRWLRHFGRCFFAAGCALLLPDTFLRRT